MSRLKPGPISEAKTTVRSKNDRERKRRTREATANGAVAIRHFLLLNWYSYTDYLGGFCLLNGDPLGGAGVEHIERESAAAENFVVEGADVEPGAQLFLCALAELDDLELA